MSNDNPSSKSKTKTKTKKTTKKKTKAKTAAGNGRALVIVESPAKAKTINKYLGSAYKVYASMGHVRDLPKTTLGVEIEDNFEPTYRILPDRKKLVAELKKFAKDAPQVYLATDLDREGEAIAWHLAKALDLPEEKIKRVMFNQITKRAIHEAFKTPLKIDLDKVNAQQARRILDRIVGYQLSPLLWKKIAKGLSAGRVQSVTVRLIVEREREIEKFIPQEHCRISAVLHTGQDLEAAKQAYDEYINECREKQQAKITLPDAKPTPLGINIGDTILHPETADALIVIDISDPSLLKIRTRLGADCQIGKKVAAKAEGQATETDTSIGQQQMQIKHESKKLKATLENNSLFEADLVEFDGEPFKADNADQAKKARSDLDTAAYTIASIQTKERKERPPAPFTTATLQQAASTRLNFTTNRIMQVAQQLYQGIELGPEGSVGLITYMRTDSRHLAPEAISAARSHIQKHFGLDYLPEKPNFYASRSTAQEAHEAIRPTDVNYRPEDVRQYVTADQFRLYELIWRQFLACQMNPARWQITEAMIQAKGPQHTGMFKATGRRLDFPGFLALLPHRLDGADAQLPKLDQGQTLDLADLRMTQHFTQPPPRFNEASLVRTLEAQGIGRPSTYAAIITTIQARGYAKKDEKKFFPTDLGGIVTDQLIQHFPKVMDVKFTSHMEEQLDKIEEAHLDWVAVLNEFYTPFKDALEQAGANMEKATGESEYTCEQCSKPMVYKWTKNGRFLACSGYPECKTSCSVDEQGQPIKKEVILTEHKCPKCDKPMILRESRYGPFLGCSGYPECKTTMPSDSQGNPLPKVKPDQIDTPCPECAKPMIAKRGRGKKGGFLACTGYPGCKHTQPIPDDIAIDWPGPEKTDIECPKCGKPMLVRRSRRGPFLGCSGFPKCRTIQPLPKDYKSNSAPKTDAQTK